MVIVSVPELNEAALAGKAAFDTFCASCHGANAAGREGFGPPLVHPIYEPRHHGKVSFLYAVTTGVRAHHWHFGDMPVIEGITEDGIAQIVVYVRALQVANGIE